MKPTLTPEQSASLNAALVFHGKSGVLRQHAQNPNGWLVYTPMGALNGLDILTLAAALTNGWEVEKSPVDVLRERFAEFREEPTQYRRDWCAGVLEALGATGQTIEGINA
ncbi:hypothetical protein M5X04_26750 [Paenibacillus alvei]|nr:hypothetical protein [Paenibacillus alvei]MCY9532912.1 hypothetical protein [Paenibacillus alvei]